MSEYLSLYIKIKIKEEKLEQYYQEKPVTAVVDDNWRSWWETREMYHKMPLTHIPNYTLPTHRAIFDELLADPRTGSHMQYDLESEQWLFTCIFFSENYTELLPMLSALKSLPHYMDHQDKGIALIYDFYWGGTAVMAAISFDKRQARLEDQYDTSQLNPSSLEEANRLLEAAVKTKPYGY